MEDNMGLFNNNYGVATTKRQVMINRYNSARYDMLAVAIFTAINLIMLATGSLSYFLFSASIPYEIASVARVMCGLYPEEVYEEILGGGYASLEFLDPAVFYVALAIAFVITAVYVVLFIFSKNNKVGCLIAGLVLFSLDTLYMFWSYGIAIENLMDILFHAFVIVLLAMGIHAHYKLKNMAPDTPPVVDEYGQADGFGGESDKPDSTALRSADMTVKSRTLLELKAYEHTIVYRRVKKVNELVIDGYVYDQYEARMEMPHVLTATIDGHDIAVGYNGNMSYATVDGQQAASKVRWY